MKLALISTILFFFNLTYAAEFLDLYDRSLKRNNEVLTSQVAKKIADLEYRVAKRSLLNPQINVVSSWNEEELSYTAEGYGTLKPGPSNQLVTALSVSQLLYDEGVRLNLKMAKMGREMSVLGAEDAVKYYTFTYIQKYVQIMLLKYSLESTKDIVMLMTRLKEAIEEIDDIDPKEKVSRVRLVTANINKTEVEVDNLENQLKTELSDFSYIVGEEVEQENMIFLWAATREAYEKYVKDRKYEPHCPHECLYNEVNFDIDESLKRALRNFSALRVPELGLQVAKLGRKAIGRSALPRFTLEGSYALIEQSPKNDPISAQQIPQVGITNTQFKIMGVSNIDFVRGRKKALSEEKISLARLQRDAAIRAWKSDFVKNAGVSRQSQKAIEKYSQYFRDYFSNYAEAILAVQGSSGSIAEISEALRILGEAMPVVAKSAQAHVAYLISRFAKPLSEGLISRRDIAYLDKFAIPVPDDLGFFSSLQYDLDEE
jgi:outer membrane protein TolC